MLHDVLRFLVRGGPRVPVNIYRLLSMIDGDEQGFESVEAWEAHLGRPLPRTNQEANEIAPGGDPANAG